MAAEDDDPHAAATRLEAALERIARVAPRDPAASARTGAMVSTEMVARLDSLIVRLRDELGEAA